MSDQTPKSAAASPAAGAPEPVAPTQAGNTEQDRLRAMYEMLFERNPDSVAYADSQGNLIINKAGQEMFRLDMPGPDTAGTDKWQQTYGCFLADGKTPHPSETLPLTRALVQRETVRDYEMICRTATLPEGIWVLCNAAPLPGGQAICVSRDITQRKQLEGELAQRNEELAVQVRENNSLIERLRLAVDELSTPVLELADDILALPVVGIVDTVRSSRMMEKILAEVVSRRCRAVIIDVTGVDVIDTSTADRLIRIARSIELLGADCVISGVQPAVAQTLTDLGVSFRGLTMQRNLKRALDVCITRLQNNRRNT